MPTPSRRAFLTGIAAIAWVAFAVAAQAVTYTSVGFAENITVSSTGIYRIVVGGAGNEDNAAVNGPGFGALVAGDLFMRSGSRYSVLVGGDGGINAGGGASMFTYAASRTVVGADRAIAGGGSGFGRPGQAEPLGSGEGGAASDFGLGGGGGGLYGSGEVGDLGGAPLTGSAAGGSPSGGFGGGDGALGFSNTAIGYGGGGGFTGGTGGEIIGGLATGGGSYLSPAFSNQIRITGGATSGALVSVDLIAPIPAPGALGLIASAVAGLILAGRRRKRED